MVERGEVEFDSCHHHAAVGPMAGVISASMKVYVVENAEHGNKSFSNLNEGYGKVLRYGAYSEEVLKKLHWMNDVLGNALADALAQSNGIDLRALIAEALHMGDEGHNRNKAGSLIYLKLISPLIAKVVKDEAVEAEVLQFIGDNALSVLNPVMAACKAMTDAAQGVECSTIVTTMARNGTDFGVRVSGLGEKEWFTAPAEIPIGLFFSGFTQDDANPDIGDSAITETAAHQRMQSTRPSKCMRSHLPKASSSPCLPSISAAHRPASIFAKSLNWGSRRVSIRGLLTKTQV
jgi:hypothetical protein